MRFLTDEESKAWANGNGYATPGEASVERMPHLRIRVPFEPGVLLTLCRTISGYMSPRSSCLLWVQTCGIWPSSENWHLYYRLRQSYGDHRLLHEAPGHFFLDFEEADFVSFLQLAILSGWDAEILPRLTYGGPATARSFISHDEWILLAHTDTQVLSEWKVEIGSRYQLLNTPAA